MSGWPRKEYSDNCPRADLCDEAQTCIGRCHPDSIFQRQARADVSAAEAALAEPGERVSIETLKAKMAN